MEEYLNKIINDNDILNSNMTCVKVNAGFTNTVYILDNKYIIKICSDRSNKDIKFDIIFTSDLIRTIDSANIAFPNIKKIQDKRLRECNYGNLDGEDKNLIVYEEHIDVPFPSGESLKDVEVRVQSFINDILKEYKGKTIGIVAHRAPQLAFEVITKNISWERLRMKMTGVKQESGSQDGNMKLIRKGRGEI